MKQVTSSIVQKFIASLVKNQAITSAQAGEFESIYATNNDALVELLLSEGIVTRRDVLIALGQSYQVPWFDVTGYFFDHQLVHVFPKDFLLRNSIIPLMIDEDELIIVAAQPSDDLLPQFGEYVSWDIQFHVGIRRHIEDAVKEFYDESIVYDTPEDLDLEQERRMAQKETEIEEADDDIEKLSDLEE